MLHVKVEGDIPIRLATLKELAAYYGISTKTLKRRMAAFAEELGPRIGNYYSVFQVATIVKHLGVKSKVRIEDH